MSERRFTVAVTVCNNAGDTAIDISRRFGGHYDPVRILYDSGGTLVLVVRHRKLGAERILKLVKKEKNISVEAEILLKLRHPGIPLLYDYEEDESYICLLEEYVQGVSLKDYLADTKGLPAEELAELAVQICEIVEYLHACEPRPVLYLDMKPEHIYLRGGQVVLIDYSASLLKPRSGQVISKYGTPGYVAPEVLRDGVADERSDIYSVGLVIDEMFRHVDGRLPGKIRRQISLATQKEASKRPSSMKEYCAGWRQIIERPEKNELRKEIAITGNEHGVGCTHISISLVIYLNAIKHSACFKNRTDQNVTQNLCRSDLSFKEKNGFVTRRLFKALYDFGSDAEGSEFSGILVKDCGTNLAEAQSADVWIHVVGSRAWQDHELSASMLCDADCLLVNPGYNTLGRMVAKAAVSPVMGFPGNDEPFGLSGEKRRFLKRLCENLKL